MVKTVFAAKGKSKSAEVVCVSQDDLALLPATE